MQNKIIRRHKEVITFFLILLAIPVIVVVGGSVFQEKYYAWVAVCVAVLSCVPLFYCFERKESTSSELVILAVLVALSVVGRFIFAWLPGFKPITAITVIVAVWLGKEAGFMVGAISAIISNFYFGQGPWTPFQMFAWGFIGFLAGMLAKPMKKNKVMLCLYGAIAGVMYSAVMDVWTVIWAENTFNLKRYGAVMMSSIPVTIMYAVSNVVFLLALAKPIGQKLERIKKKYGLFLK